MHVGLIVDGARRWGRREAVPLQHAYGMALDRTGDLVRRMFDNGVDAVSLYLLSRDNLRRSETDLTAVFEATAQFLSSDAVSLANEYKVTFFLAGDSTAVPGSYRSAIDSLVQSAPNASPSRRIYLLIAYSPAEELAACWRPGLNAMNELITALWVPERVDLVIRTGGAALLSDFLPLQSGYARLWSTPLLSPELTWQDVAQTVLDVLDNVQLRGA